VSQYEGIELFDDDFLNNNESIKVEISEKQKIIDTCQEKLISHDSLSSEDIVNIKKDAEKAQKRINRLKNKLNKVATAGLFDKALEVAQQNAKLLQSKIAQYVTIDSKGNKKTLKKEIDDLKWDLIEATLEERDETDKLDKIKEQRKDRVKPFFIWKLEFGDVFKNDGGFDLVIGNPPYIQLQKAINDYSKTKHGDLYKNCGYETFKRAGDIYALFYELGVNVLKDTGHLTYITSNKWMRAGYGDVLRGFFTRQNPKLLLDFGGFKVFENATVDVNILLAQKTSNQNKLQASHFKNDYQKDNSIADYFYKTKVELSNLSSDTWFIGSKAEISLKQKIEKIGVPLKDWDVKISYGVKTGYNTAFIIDKDKYTEIIDKDKGSKDIIKPILRGRDIKHYGHAFAELYIVIIKYKSHKELPAKYPVVYEHLVQFEGKLKNRGQCTNKGGLGQHHWLELDNNPGDNYINQFYDEKIMYPVMSSEASFFYDNKGFFCNDKGFIISGSKLKYLVACLNSKITHRYLEMICSPLGDAAVEYRKIYLDLLPVPLMTLSNQSLVGRVEELVELRINNNESEITNNEIEQKIDQLVYQLYDLTDKEIAIVEKASN
jgi:hypothetical protein